MVDDAMVDRYVEAVNAHLAGLTAKDWEVERFDPAASVRRVARIGLTAAVAPIVASDAAVSDLIARLQVAAVDGDESGHSTAADLFREAATTLLQVSSKASAEDTKRLDWMDSQAFTAYRTRDAEDGSLFPHVTVCNEDAVGSRVGQVRPTIREAIDAASA